MVEITITSVVAEPARLGEGPVWSPAEQVLYWIDIKAPAVHRYDPASGQDLCFPMPEPIGSVALRASGGLLGAFKTGIKTIDLASGRIETLAAPEPDLPGNRFNDGRCDRRGRFWTGTMDDASDGKIPTGSFYRVDAAGRCVAVRRGIKLPNGPAWSPDGRVMYLVHTAEGRICAYDFDLEAGTMSNERVFVEVPEEAGHPDGLTVDAEGGVWSAHYGGGRITRYAPDGSIDRVVTLPAPNVTSCAFGGEGLETLYVTTATEKMTQADRQRWPEAGHVFAVKGLGLRGQAETPFNW